MSILNIHVSPMVARVYVDTLVDRSGTYQHGEKMVVLPQANLVIAGRGDLVLLAHLAASLANLSPAGYDAAMLGIDDVLHDEVSAYEAVREMQGHEPLQGLEFVLAGWSQQGDTCAATRWERWPGEESFKATLVDPWSLSPDAGTGQPDEPDTVERMIAYARGQVRRLAPMTGAVGGRLILAEVTRDGIATRSVAELLEVH